MIDPELKYCPKCKDEFRAEITVCAVCDANLLTGIEMLARQREGEGKRSSRKGRLSDTDDLVAVRRGPLGELRTYEQLLEAEGIATMMAGDEHSCGKGCCAGNFDLVVRREEAAEAEQLIEAEIRRTSRIDTESADHHDAVFNSEAAETVCPACGHKFPPAPECPDCGLCF
jgi:hypothetical protein